MVKFEETPKTGCYYILKSNKLTDLYHTNNKHPKTLIKSLNFGCRYFDYTVKGADYWPLYIIDVNKFMLGILKYEL
jgi:hypothetical protein